MTVPGFTSTGSKRPEVLFGTADIAPRLMARSEGYSLWDENGVEYIDMMMALGAVTLGYAHPRVVAAATEAVRNGTIGSLAPRLEHEVAERLVAVIPGAESARFFKTGAEAVAAAVRLARVVTGREHIVTCGYHGWLDWCQVETGVPKSMTQLRTDTNHNGIESLTRAINATKPAAVVLEPVIDGPPDPRWLEAARHGATQSGAILVFDEIKTAFRIAAGGAGERYGVQPDLVVVGKALGNGFPIAAVCGPQSLMHAFTRTWVSSTLATEYVSLAAAGAVLDVFDHEDVIGHLRRVGTLFWSGLEQLVQSHPEVFSAVCGVPEMCYSQFVNPAASELVAVGAAQRGVLFKRSAYNFVCLAHTDEVIDRVIRVLDEVAGEAKGKC
jgi:glutamate-1-semialdehyde 2,1-aminomutase